jgi:hypothetical protein
VHSSAVIEHVGDRGRQTRLLSELWRVARRGVFVTTPNRWFPVEVHTMLPLLHWLPPRWYRAILRRIGLPFFASEANLNLLSRRDLVRLARAAGITDFHILTVNLFGLTSNLILVAHKDLPPTQTRGCVARPGTPKPTGRLRSLDLARSAVRRGHVAYGL